MKKGYLILAHSDPIHLRKLVDSLGNNLIFIHLDIKKNLEEFTSYIPEKNNIHFIQERHSISWGGFSMVEAMLALIKNALTNDVEVSHLVFLSGNDYPIKSPEKINQFFLSNQDNQLIRGFNLTRSNCNHCLEKVERKWYFDSKIKHPIQKKISVTIKNFLPQFKKNSSQVEINQQLVDVYFGSQWIGITKECAEYVVDTVESNPQLKEYFENTSAPDEMFFHTIIFNSPFKYHTIQHGGESYSAVWQWNNYTWLDPAGLSCTKTNKVTIQRMIVGMTRELAGKKRNRGSVSFLNESDFEKIKNTEFIFARKFSSEYSSKLIENIQKQLASDEK